MADSINIMSGPGLMNRDEISAKRHLYRLMLIMTLAMGLRLIQWNLIDSLYRDTVNFIAVAERFSIESLKDPVQEPMHPLILRGIHAVLFPREVPASAINVSSWELTVLADGLFFTLICLWLLYAIGKHLHSPAAGLWAAFFLAILPYGVEYSINGLSELPYTAFLLLSVYLILRAKEKNEMWFMLMAGACAALLILTRKEGMILIPIMILYLLYRHHFSFCRKMKQSAFFLMGAGLILGGYYLIGGRFYWIDDYVRIVRMLAHENLFKEACAGDNRFVFALSLIDRKYEYLTLPVESFFKLSGIIPAVLFLIYLTKRRGLKINAGINLLILYAFIHFIMVMVQTIFTNFYVGRYLFPICLILFPVAGVMMIEILSRINLRYGKTVEHPQMSQIITLILLVGFIGEILQNGFTSRHPEILAASRWLEANTPVNTLISTTDDRVGFYSYRPWKNVKLGNISNDIQFLPSNDLINYFSVAHKKIEQDSILSFLNQSLISRNIQIKIIQVFSNKKNQITIYRLRAMPVTPPATEPTAQ